LALTKIRQTVFEVAVRCVGLRSAEEITEQVMREFTKDEQLMKRLS